MQRIGTVTGTGAAIHISLGFVPDYVKVINTTDGDTIHEWFKGMTDDTAIKTALAVAPLNAGGMTPYAGDDTHAPGITLGTDISENLKTLRYIATRDEKGSGGQ